MGIVVDKLNADKAMYELQQERLPPRIAIASSLRDAFNGPASEAMGSIVSGLDSANNIKSQIVSIGGNTGLSTDQYGSSTANVSSLYGNVVVSTGTTLATSLGVVGLGTSAVIAYGVVKNDIGQVYDYPKISGGSYGSDYPFEGEGYTTLTSSNVGSGVSTRLVRHGGSQIGVVFDVPVNVATLVSNYDSAYSTAGSFESVATEAQKIKGDYDLQVWGLNRQYQENVAKLSEINTSLGIAQDPATGGPW